MIMLIWQYHLDPSSGVDTDEDNMCDADACSDAVKWTL